MKTITLLLIVLFLSFSNLYAQHHDANALAILDKMSRSYQQANVYQDTGQKTDTLFYEDDVGNDKSIINTYHFNTSYQQKNGAFQLSCTSNSKEHLTTLIHRTNKHTTTSVLHPSTKEKKNTFVEGSLASVIRQQAIIYNGLFDVLPPLLMPEELTNLYFFNCDTIEQLADEQHHFIDCYKIKTVQYLEFIPKQDTVSNKNEDKPLIEPYASIQTDFHLISAKKLRTPLPFTQRIERIYWIDKELFLIRKMRTHKEIKHLNFGDRRTSEVMLFNPVIH